MKNAPIRLAPPAKRRAVAALVALGLALAALPATGQDFEAVRIETVEVRGGIHMLVGRGGNIGVSTGADGVFLIDDQYAPLGDKILAAVRALDAGPVRFVLNTHWHGDHTGGNEHMRKTGAVIVAHDAVRARMSTDQFMAAMNRKVPASPRAALPVVTFTDSVTFHWNGDTLRAEHVPAAHTDGDSFVHWPKADVIHTGDVFFNGMYPFLDMSSGGSMDGLIAAAERILEVAGPDTRIIPGHGSLARRADLEAYRKMLVKVRGRVLEEIADDRPVDEFAPKLLDDLKDQWEKGFLSGEQFTRLVHASLSAGVRKR